MDVKQTILQLPDRLEGLADLAYNLWWSWHPEAMELFRTMNLQAWRDSGQNPIRMLSEFKPENFQNLIQDSEFLQRYDRVMAQFQKEQARDGGWFASRSEAPDQPIAYFSAEYGLHSSLPLYAGGLGMLAGDYLKECSDLRVPVVAVGLVYSQGYVRQKIRDDGWQEDVEETLDRMHDPITQMRDEQGEPLQIRIPVFDPPIYAAIWRAQVGRIPLFLLDTDIEANQPWDRAIAHHLYATNPEQRLRQEIVLGMGGICALDQLGIKPVLLHINEGHPALAALERIRKAVHTGQSFDDALAMVHRTTIFTTHTPVAAGTDIFPYQLMERYFEAYLKELGVGPNVLADLGVNPDDKGAGFNLTVFALRMAGYQNAVSRKHGEVARKMWQAVWPDTNEEEVPIQSITNGVHLPGWIEPVRLQPLLSHYLGDDWVEHQDEKHTWEAVDQIPDDIFWQLRQEFKVEMIAEINERARRRWEEEQVPATSIIAHGSLLDSEVFTLGFARRFTGYKRPDLFFTNMDRCKKLLTDPNLPMQIVFAGKAHPADTDGKRLIQKIFRLAQDPVYGGRIAFVQEYDRLLAEYLVRGVDLWLNNPLPPLEACGTSGMKAGVNGTPNLAIADGWWPEGYSGQNGWLFGERTSEGDRTGPDAEELYQLLEQEILPLYYERSDDEIPHDYIRIMKASLMSLPWQFSARRMTKEYVDRFYTSALQARQPVQQDHR